MRSNFYMPTEIINEDNAVQNNASLIKTLGKKSMIVTGKYSSKLNGALDDIKTVLKKNNQEFVIYDKIASNPTMEFIFDGADLARKSGIEFMIGIGGGSSMDSAKIIALLVKQVLSFDDLVKGGFHSNSLPLVMIPTTAGSGSEVTPYAVITNHKEETKTTISHPSLFPKIAFLDAKYTDNLPIDTTIDTALDALSHSIEGLLSKKANDLSNLLAKESITLITSCFSALQNRNIKRNERKKLLYASTLAGMVISQTSTTSIHAMGYPLTYYKNISHGRANGLLIADFLKTIQFKSNGKVDNILSLMQLDNINDLKIILDKIIVEKETLAPKELDKCVTSAANSFKHDNCVIRINKKDIIQIYTDIFSN